MIRKYTLPLLSIIGLGVTLVVVIQDNCTPAKTQPSLTAATAPFSSYVFGPGIVEASTENVAVGTPVSGIVTAIYVKWGDRVKSGAPLFKVDTRELEAQLMPATSRVREVEAQFPLAAAKVEEAKANLAKVENRVRVGEGLEPGVSVSAEDLANRQSDVGIDKAILAAAQAQVEQIKTQVASAQAQVGQIKAQIDLRTIRAPVSGRILQIKTRLGEYAQSVVLTTPLMLIGDDTTLHVRVDIDENDAWKFQPCERAMASVRGNPEIRTPLQYVRTDPYVIPKTTLTGDTTQRTDTRVLQVIYSFDPGSLPLYVGQLMDVFIETAPAGVNPCGDPSHARSKP